MFFEIVFYWAADWCPTKGANKEDRAAEKSIAFIGDKKELVEASSSLVESRSFLTLDSLPLDLAVQLLFCFFVGDRQSFFTRLTDG